MSIEAALAFFVAMIVFAATPGPGILAVLAQALSAGTRPALWLSAGLVLGDLVYFAFAVFGLSAIASLLGELFNVVKLIGGAYLIWLGVQIWRAPIGHLTGANLPRAVGKKRAFLTGLLVTLSNPKAVIFYLGFLPAFVDLAALTPLALLQLMILLVVALALVLAAYVFGAQRAKNLLQSPSGERRLNRGAGAMLVGAGALLATRQ
jgi:threonine/homoserine/homoserine lactone efflux protein